MRRHKFGRVDNVTHSLAGLLLAECSWQARQARVGEVRAGAGYRTVAAIAGVVAANLPDVDVPYGAARRLDSLASLLQHRGYTHTVLAAAIGAVLTWAVTLGVWRWRARGTGAVAHGATPDGATDRRWLFGLIAVAVSSHLALDWTNDYGVHPLSPFDNTWHYGDAVFIVEPWLWVAAVPPLLFTARGRAARVVLGILLVAAVALAWGVSLVPWGAALVLTAGAAAALVVAARIGSPARALLGVGGWLAVELAFAAGTRAARAQVVAAAGAEPGARLIDVVITPAPADPLCARAIAVETLGRGARATYRVTTAWAAALPGVLPAARCTPSPRALSEPSLAMIAPDRSSTAGVAWGRSWRAPLAELVALGRDNCWAMAVLRFARVPVWTPSGADSVVVEDLRYDRGGGAGFAGFTIPRRPTACPTGVPPWRPPRAALLGPDSPVPTVAYRNGA